MIALLTLAQDTPAAAPGPQLWAVLLDNAFALTILFIFLAAIISVVVQVRRKDKCLKLLNTFHVSYLTTTGQAIWGDLTVYSSGLELRFDAPYTTRHGLHKQSALIYEDQLKNCLAICRTQEGLTPKEKKLRGIQVRRSYAPGLFRRSGRSFRNAINTLKDAFAQALTALIGQLAKARPGSAMATQQSQVNQIGQTLLGAAGNAYEPLLEAHIGRPVILTLTPPASPTPDVTAPLPLELPGYLVDYTQHYVAVFNVEHEPIESIQLKITTSHQQPGLRVELTDDRTLITCTGPEVVVVQHYKAGPQASQLMVPLTPGCQLGLPREPEFPVELTLERTRNVDLVCPRSLATIYFGADDTTAPSPAEASGGGVAPVMEAS